MHRKVAMYRALMDFADGDGHGTHCAGSAAGSFQNSEPTPLLSCVRTVFV